ncbi:tyrosine-type recombinase/integrase [Falsihalocynthiibacter arcticus]|uniref:Integrase n=1 Tax=Falsihalocynthiibacter arcticus TaxID=1579316 RepID=A0A126UWI1_9RHOB|nr:tyrosine-type recombinase/integrase [Falsihalocynthiibacter arcticus]AML50413.1 integrase [Falsihalocynthiibacter arcticus]
MRKQPAKILGKAELCRLLKAVEDTRQPTRNRTIILLSFHAGLRACEISGLTWPMVLSPSGKLVESMELGMGITKGGKTRSIPTSIALRASLRCLHREDARPKSGPVICSERGGPMTPRSVVNWFRQIYDDLDMPGCSSHSGRRTFITTAARLLPKINGSLRDIQELAGHRSLSTTERYIQGDRMIQRQLVNLI